MFVFAEYLEKDTDLACDDLTELSLICCWWSETMTQVSRESWTKLEICQRLRLPRSCWVSLPCRYSMTNLKHVCMCVDQMKKNTLIIMKMKWFHRNKREQPLFHESLPTSESNDSKSPDWWQSIKIPILHFIRHNMPQIRKLFQQLILTVVVIRRRVVWVNVSVAVSMTKMIVFMIPQLCFHLTRAPIGQYSVKIHNTQLWLVDTRMNWICDDSCEI